MIKAVLFDFGGVLTEGGKGGSIKDTLATLYGIETTKVHHDDLSVQMFRGQISTEDFFKELNRRHPGEIALTEDIFNGNSTVFFTKAAPVYELAASLKSHGIRTGILSNVYGFSAKMLKERGFYEGFDPLVLSCAEGHAKPDQELYDIAVQKTGVKPEEILFIDDQEKCMSPAVAMGMHTVVASSADQIVRDVKALIARENNLSL